MRKIEMTFYNINPGKAFVGLKFVLFEITTDESQIIYDWGFAEWLGDQWGEVPTPENFTCKVIRWADTVDPDLLLKEESKIIKI